MKIQFSKYGDGMRPLRPRSSWGEVMVGPQGLLKILETRLGLGGEFPSDTTRMAQYLACLHKADHGKRFYSNSLIADELATARVLLKWRDTWVEAGWSGSSKVNTGRISDMAAVEDHASTLLGYGYGDRLRRVLMELKTTRTDITSVLVHEPMAEYHGILREILLLLSAAPYPAGVGGAPLASPGTDLFTLQRSLMDGSKIKKLKRDGSVLMLTGTSERELSQLLGAYLTQNKLGLCGDRSELEVMICEGNAAILDDGLAGLDLARATRGDYSTLRPASQIIPLAYALFWDPLDPFKLLEFLTHPVNPIPDQISFRLADALMEKPGVGNEVWNKVLETAIERWRSDNPGSRDTPPAQAAMERWIMVPRFDADVGAPLDLMLIHAELLQQWAQRNMGREGISPSKQRAYLTILSDASSLLELFRALIQNGEATLTKLKLDELIASSVQSEPSPVAVPEVGHIPVFTNASAIYEGVDRIYWWDFVGTGGRYRWPWSRSEILALQEAGAHIPEASQLLAQTADAWQRTILKARKQVVFVTPDFKHGERVAHHPLWDRLNAALGENQRFPVIPVDDLLSGKHKGVMGNLPLDEHSHHPLPGKNRWWKIERSDLLTPRETESYTSIDSFLFRPYQWVLQYKAGLYQGKLKDLNDGPRLYGNLSHRLIEAFFTQNIAQWSTPTPKQIKAWIDSKLPDLLRTEGAILLMPGRAKDIAMLQAELENAIVSLRDHLVQAKVTEIQMESPITGLFQGRPLGGAIDMLVRTDAGAEGVVDIKWGQAKYKLDSLAQNTHIQLAVYAKSREEMTGKWPAEAYFMVNGAHLLAQDQNFFKKAWVKPPEDGENTKTLWTSIVKTWEFRRDLLDRGKIEINVSGTTKDKNSDGPEGCLEFEETDDRFSIYDALTGWEPNS